MTARDKPSSIATYLADTLIVSFTNCWKVLKGRTDSNPHQYLCIGIQERRTTRFSELLRLLSEQGSSFIFRACLDRHYARCEGHHMGQKLSTSNSDGGARQPHSTGHHSARERRSPASFRLENEELSLSKYLRHFLVKSSRPR